MDWVYSTHGCNNPRGKQHLGDISRDGRVILKWVVHNFVLRTGAGFIYLRTGTSGGFLDYIKESSSIIS
jgi:hypothetical protein